MTLSGARLLRVSVAMNATLVVLLGACGQNEPTEAQRKQCFDRYIREHQAEYPVETLKKTAALKCYS
jgi:hypothetical protein